MAQFFEANILAFRELLDISINTSHFMWNGIALSKENTSPKKFELEWIMVQEKLQCIKQVMLELNPTISFQSVNPKNLELVFEDILKVWVYILRPDNQLVRDELLHSWIKLQDETKELRTQLKDIYLRI